MKTFVLSNSLFNISAEQYLDPLLNLLAYDSLFYLLVPLKFKSKEFIQNLRNSHTPHFYQKIGHLFRILNHNNRIIRISMDEGSFCRIVKSELADYEFYFEDPDIKSNISPECQKYCAASQSSRGEKINDLPDYSSKKGQIFFDLLPNNSTITDLENFLKTTIIRFTQKLMILDPYLGKIIEKNGYSFPPTLEMIYSVFKQNLVNYRDIWDDFNPEFVIHTLGDKQLEQLNSRNYVRINWYSSKPSEFPHDRFLKTEYVLTQWGTSFDLFDSKDLQRATGIILTDKTRFKTYRLALRSLK